MMFSLCTLDCPVASRAATFVAAQGLSTQTNDAVEKLKSVLEGYCLANYAQKLPTRFKKDSVKAAVVHNHFVSVDGVKGVLSNIGAEQRLSKQDLNLIFIEVGVNGEIPVSHFICMI